MASLFKFKQKESHIPYKSIITAIILFVLGSIMIIIAALLYTGHINVQVSFKDQNNLKMHKRPLQLFFSEQIKYSDRMWPVFTIGMLMFIPGFYHVRIAYYAWRQYEGYSFDDLPEDN